MTEPIDNKQLLAMTAEIVAAHVGGNVVPKDELPKFVRDVHAALAATARGETPSEARTPAASVERSVRPDHIVCLECGKKLKALKRHLQAHHRLTPHEYRERWSWRADYPTVAPTYDRERSRMAKEIGLGRKGRDARLLGQRPAEGAQFRQDVHRRAGARRR